jgi:hypothetical protein
LGGKLTLISAPAGFGKTTLLSMWLAVSSRSGRSAVWLSLDPADNDPTRFWRYFIAVADRLYPGAGDTALVLLQSPQAYGRLRVRPVSPLAGDGERYVFTFFDEADWIKNVRTAGWRLLSRAAGGAGDVHTT